MKEIPTQLRKMAKCMIYIGSYACGECYGNSFTPFTPSPRRSRPLGGSVINGTIQQLLDTHHGHPTGQFVHPQVGGVPNSATQPRNVVSSTRTRQGTPSARTAPHSAPTWFHRPDIHEDVARHPLPPTGHTAAQRGFISEDAARPTQRLVRAGAGIFPQWGILKNNRKESIHETRWTSPRRRASSWIPERRHGGHAGGAVGIAGRAGGYCYRGTGGHCPERHQRVGAGIGGLCDTRSNAWAATIGTKRRAIARHTPRYVRFGHRQLVSHVALGV